MKVCIFPGQGSQFVGMGQELYEQSAEAKSYFERANKILGYDITEVMFSGTADELKATKMAQPAIFLHSVLIAKLSGANLQFDAVAGHSLGELSALTAANALSFEGGLDLVKQRATAMETVCQSVEGTMAAIIGLDDQVIEEACAQIEDLVVAANYNTIGQVVISGTVKGVETGIEQLKEAGARMAVQLPVAGAFHSPMMEPALASFSAAVENAQWSTPSCPVYQNVDALANQDVDLIKQKLINQLTQSVRWRTTMENLIAAGANHFVEVGGKGKVLAGMLKPIDRTLPVEYLSMPLS